MNSKAQVLLTAAVLALAIPPTGLQAQQPLLQITSPAGNSAATEGTTITISVSVDPSVQLAGIVAQSPLPDVQGTSSPNQFTLTIPTGITPGLYNLTAIGDNDSGDVESAPVAIDVEWQYYPTSITATPPMLNLLAVGDQMPVRIMGSMVNRNASGALLGYVTLDITNSTQMVYTSNNPHVATVSSSGMITAVGPGQTSILAQAGAYTGETFPIYAAVLVNVPAQPPTGTPPAVTSVSPTSGIPGSTQVTITGSGFGASQGSGYVQIGTLSGVVNSWSNTQIVATVPTGSQNGAVQVSQGGLYSNSTPFTISAPVIQGMSASAFSPGSQVTLNGTGFGATQGGGGVYFVGPGGYGSIVSWSDTQVIFTVPAGLIPGSVIVLQNNINSNAVNYTMVPPVLNSISPTAVIPGMQMTLNGSGFGSTVGNGYVYFDFGAYGTVVSWNDTQVVVTVPNGISGGGIVEVGQNNVNSNQLSYSIVPPTLTGISSSTWSAGMQVTLTGSGFGATQGNEGGVYFCCYGIYGSVVSWSDTQVVFTVPSGLPSGTVLVYQNNADSNQLSYTDTD